MLRIVKLGGSLLASRETKGRLLEWLQQQSDCKTVLIVGGGRLVDCVREWDENYQLGETTCHRLALTCMTVTSRLVAGWLPTAVLLDDIDQVRESTRDLILMNSESWVLNNALLPRSWQLTSDSIAAAIAKELSAEELVMLKSRLPLESDVDFFDPLFSRFATTSTIRVVDLRSNELFEVIFQP